MADQFIAHIIWMTCETGQMAWHKETEQMADNTKVHKRSAHAAHHIDLFMFKGAPVNEDPDNEVQILINQGYVVGFCPHVHHLELNAVLIDLLYQDVDFDRPHVYYADERLDTAHRLSSKTFGKIDGVQYHVGHMVPNEAINRQFGRLAQLETFFMSTI